MSEIMAQNLIEAQLALEHLEPYIGTDHFRRESIQVRQLLETLKLTEGEYAERLSAMKLRHGEQHAQQSVQIRQDIENRLAQVSQQIESSEQMTWQERNILFQVLYQELENSQLFLEQSRYQLIRSDADLCWAELKRLRSLLRQSRQDLQRQLATSVQAILDKATEVVRETRHLGEAREQFKRIQHEFHQLPLKREQRQNGRLHFDALWKELQDRNQQYRQEKQRRQQDSVRRLEEALHNVESFLQRKSPELEALYERLAQAHWNEVEPIEKQVQREERGLKDAQRRRREILQKLGRDEEISDSTSGSKPGEIETEISTVDA